VQTPVDGTCEDAVVDEHGTAREPDLPPAAAESLTALARVTGELSGATTVDEVTRIVTQHVADAVGATIATLALREGEDQVRLVGTRGLDAPEAVQWEVFSLGVPNTVTEVIRTGRRLVLVGAAEIAARYPDLPIPGRGERCTVTVPLRVAGRTKGVIHLSVPGATAPDPTALEFLDILADVGAQALERIEASAVAATQTHRLTFLAEASIQLASSLDIDVTAARVAQLAVPRFADWCAIDVVRDGALHRLAVAHVDPEKVELARRLHERWPPDPSRPDGLMHVVRTGQPLLLSDITDEVLEAMLPEPERLEVARELGLRSALSVPLLVRGRVSGVLTWVSSDEGRRYDEDDVLFAEHLARRSASAIDNADLFSQTRDVAEQLQHAVLPAGVSGTETFEVRSHYEPSGRTEVGGDFYDAFPLVDGRVVAFVGDVMGRGVAAAAAMAQMRSAVRAFVSVDASPEAVVDGLDRMVRQFETEQLVTLVVVLADPRHHRLRIVNAGHVAPVVLRKDGTTEPLPWADGPPLGLASGRRGVDVPFGPGDTLLVVTDGLVERRDEDIAAGMARLADAVHLLEDPDLGVGLERVVGSIEDATSDDDLAALALRRTR
jgi:serine phosphatase RsbU (regulator of sigma subunit)